mmetsp:Transcript_24464/g.24044  ORF Transcript_24464/g.24044 Transcript_24464/m.24044 type:complete len:108 (+) Transcript_24464:448-771(+)
MKYHVESIQGKLEEMERGRAQEQVVAKAQEEIDLLQREKRRMDELITLKERQLTDQEKQIESTNKKVKKLEEANQLLKKQYDQKTIIQDEKYKKELARLEQDLQGYQ